MDDQGQRKILGSIQPGEFVGRSAELERLTALSTGSTATIVAGAPGVGVTELLKQTYDRLFQSQMAVVPFYFSLDPNGESAERMARRFLHRFLLQTVAFRRRDASILNFFPDLWELAELALPADGHWVDRLVSKFAPTQPATEIEALIKTCLGAPIRAVAGGAEVFVMIDGCNAAAHSEAASTLLHEIENIYRGSGVPFVLAGRRRFAFNSLDGKRVSVEPLEFGDTARVVEGHAARSGVRINDETRDLIANQFNGDLRLIRYLFRSASEKNEPLDSFMNVEKVYAQEIFGGRIRRHFDRILAQMAPNEDVQKSIVSLLDVAATLGTKQLSVESWLKRLAVGDAAFQKILDLLNIHEMVRVTSGRIEVMDGNQVLTDYVSSRFRLEVAGENRAALFGECVAAYLKRAPKIMAAYYRKLAALGLRELLSTFSLQRVPLAVLDYGVYSELYKGLPEEEIIAGLDADEDRVQLPQIVYTANAADLYKPIGELAEKERSAVALGFQEGRYNDEDEVVWVSAEIDAKLEASREAAEFWCDRLEMVALMCNFQNNRVWLISPEGFAPDAVELLRERGAMGSSRRQVEHLRRMLHASGKPQPTAALDEYEVVVPMDDESEMIAAHTLEEIARRHNVPPKTINQIKTALLEASINASEHSLSPDRRIRQKFRVEDGRIVITISNRGLRLSDNGPKPAEGSGEEQPSAERRGWGLKLIEKLMDEVKIEQTDDGTSISMTKYFSEEPLAQAAG